MYCFSNFLYAFALDLKHKQGRLAKVKAAKKALEQREEQINPGQAIEESKQISFADTESRIMGKKGSSFDYAYNAQISVDADLQIIVAQHISQNANDQQEVEPALEALQETTDRLPDRKSVPSARCKAVAANPPRAKPAPSLPMTKKLCVNR